MGPGNWTKPAEEMGPGGSGGVIGRGRFSDGSIRQRSDPGSGIDWAAYVNSRTTKVVDTGLGSGSFSASLMVNRESFCCSLHRQYSTSGLLLQVMRRSSAGKYIFKLFILAVILYCASQAKIDLNDKCRRID